MLFPPQWSVSLWCTLHAGVELSIPHAQRRKHEKSRASEAPIETLRQSVNLFDSSETLQDRIGAEPWLELPPTREGHDVLGCAEGKRLNAE
jgi:hypothetical protein